MIGFPFDSLVTYDEHGNPSYDRAVSSKPLKSLIAKLFTTGVMPNPSDNLQVFAGAEGMTVTVKAGYCVIEGGLKLEESDRTLQVQASDTAYDRIDTVVMRWNGNDNARVCDLYVVEGTAAQSPVRPELNRVGSIYEIGLADIFIPANSSVISQQRITDTRYEAARCGIVSSVSEWDTTTIYQQVQSDLADFKAEEQADFITWYNSVKDMIDELTAAQLESEIQALSDDTVHSFNGRKGAVTLSSSDVTTALGFTPVSSAVSSFNTRTGAVTLTSGDVTTALGYTPPQQDTTYSGSTTVTLTGTTFSLTKGNVTTALGYTPATSTEATQSAAGLMSAADKTKLDGVANNANNYSLPLAASGTRGGIQIGYSESGNNYAVKLSSEKAYVTVTKTTSQVTRTATTYVQGATAEAALQNLGQVYVYDLAVATWATNSGDYPYKYTITIANRYTANSSPMWMIISNSGATAVPSATEMAEGAKVAVAMFTASNIVLYATDKPSVALKLLVKGV